MLLMGISLTSFGLPTIGVSAAPNGLLRKFVFISEKRAFKPRPNALCPAMINPPPPSFRAREEDDAPACCFFAKILRPKFYRRALRPIVDHKPRRLSRTPAPRPNGHFAESRCGKFYLRNVSPLPPALD